MLEYSHIEVFSALPDVQDCEKIAERVEAIIVEDDRRREAVLDAVSRRSNEAHLVLERLELKRSPGMPAEVARDDDRP